VPDCCVSIITVAKDQQTADRHALALARYAWDRREAFTVPKYSAQEAVGQALSMGEGPILINDSADNPGSGAPGDGTHLLRELLRRDLPTAYSFIYDPEVVQQAMAAGVGATISCRLGGKTDNFHGEPIELTNATVRCISDGHFVRQSLMGFGGQNSLGPTVCLQVGNVEIAVASVRTQVFDEGPFVTAGITWRNKRLVALKSAQHFKGWWADKVKGIVACDAPGVGSADLRTFRFRHANTNYYPLGDAQWSEE
jgi:microcystin degradation protein MlrC